MSHEEADFDEVERALRRQDEALALLERLRRKEPVLKAGEGAVGGRREGRRWPTPEGVTLELHDGERRQAADCRDLGIGGGRVQGLPEWANGPTPARLRGHGGRSVLVLSDVMWRDPKTGTTGLRFEFLDAEERDQWTGLLIDALLAKYATG